MGKVAEFGDGRGVDNQFGARKGELCLNICRRGVGGHGGDDSTTCQRPVKRHGVIDAVRQAQRNYVLVLIVPIVFTLFPIWMDKLESIVLHYDDTEDVNLPTPTSSNPA